MSASDVRTAIAAHQFFEGLGPDQLDTLATCGEPIEFRAGETLAREGQPAEQFYAVESGHLAIQIHVPQRGAVTVATVGPGEVLGWSWMLEPHRWHFDAVATETTRAVAFDAARLRFAMDDDDELNAALTRRVAAVMTRRLVAARLQLLDLYGAP